MELVKLLKPMLDDMAVKPIIKVEWFHPFVVEEGCSEMSKKLFASFDFINYEARNERTNEVLSSCDSKDYIPDIVLVPRANGILDQPIDFDTTALEHGLKLQAERDVPFWLALNKVTKEISNDIHEKVEVMEDKISNLRTSVSKANDEGNGEGEELEQLEEDNTTMHLLVFFSVIGVVIIFSRRRKNERAKR